MSETSDGGAVAASTPRSGDAQKPTVPEALDRLRKRGADDVAAVLRAAGVTGEPCRANFCPIARYVQQLTGDETVGVSSRMLQYKESESWQQIDLPRSARTFVSRFDDGHEPYRDLRSS